MALALATADRASAATLPTTDGFYGIWYSNAASGDQYVYKYSGGLGTYTHQTSPLAIYSAEVDRTYFVYGGNDGTNNVLKNYISYYDHGTGLLARPREIRHVGGADNHKNATFTIDDDGHLWVFGNSHGNGGSGNLYKSSQPHTIAEFDELPMDPIFNNDDGLPKLAYSNPFYVSNQGFIAVYNSYDEGRAVHVATSQDGLNWTDQQLFDTNRGHYTVARQHGDTIGVIANYHNSGLDNRTNLYYMQTSDLGQTWTTAGGGSLTTPMTSHSNPALVHDYLSENRLVYMKDIDYDAGGNPILTYLTVSDETGSGHKSGPQPGGRTLHTAHWTGGAWQIRDVLQTDHNYDHGELTVEVDGTWRIVGPFIDGPQQFGTGGEVGIWTSSNQGESWEMVSQITEHSQFNHTYVRQPVNANDEFYSYWADGNAFAQSASRLYFANKDGDVYRMPTGFTGDFAAPELVTFEPPPPPPPLPPGGLRAYEKFDYANSGAALLADKNGGAGWAGPWTFTGAATGATAGFETSQDDISLASGAFPFEPEGDRLLLAGPGSGGNTFRADRQLAETFDLSTEGGSFYASFMFRKTVSGGDSGNNMEFDLLAAGGVPLRFGSTSGDRLFIHSGGSVPASATFADVVIGEEYFVVIRIESSADGQDVFSALVLDSNSELPAGEPSQWHGTAFTSSSAIIDGVRLWIGTLAAGEFDEMRIGTSWLSVTSLPVAGDFNGDGNVDGADFVIWQTNFPSNSGEATLATGDANGDGNVDGADFVIWQTNFPTHSGAGAEPVPEPTGALLACLAAGLAWVSGYRGNRSGRGAEVIKRFGKCRP